MITPWRWDHLRWYERLVLGFVGVGVLCLLAASAVRETLCPRPWGTR